MPNVQVRDMEAWVSRPDSLRQQESEKRNGYITRPMNSFMLYRSAYAETTKQWCLQNNHQVVSSVSGESWPLESEEVREHYNRLARIERDNHARAFPNYKFSPSKGGAAASRRRKTGNGADSDADDDDDDADESGNEYNPEDSDAEWKPKRARTALRQGSAVRNSRPLGRQRHPKVSSTYPASFAMDMDSHDVQQHALNMFEAPHPATHNAFMHPSPWATGASSSQHDQTLLAQQQQQQDFYDNMHLNMGMPYLDHNGNMHLQQAPRQQEMPYYNLPSNTRSPFYPAPQQHPSQHAQEMMYLHSHSGTPLPMQMPMASIPLHMSQMPLHLQMQMQMQQQMHNQQQHLAAPAPHIADNSAFATQQQSEEPQVDPLLLELDNAAAHQQDAQGDADADMWDENDHGAGDSNLEEWMAGREEEA